MKPYVSILHKIDIDFEKALSALKADSLFLRADNLYTTDDKARIGLLWKDVVRPFLKLRWIIRFLYWRSIFTFGSKNSFVVKYASIITYYNMVHKLRNIFWPHEEFLRQYLDDTFSENYSTLARYMYHVRFLSVLSFPHEFFLTLRDNVDSSLWPLFDRKIEVSWELEKRISFDFINIWYYFRYRITLILSWISRHGGMFLSDIYFSRRDNGYITRENIDRILTQIQPWDICITRRNWAATNLSIPGFWKHMSMYLWTGEYLKKNFAEMDSVSWLHDSEHYIIEAVWTGVRITPIEMLCFHNDYLGVMRTKFSDEKVKRAIKKTLSLIHTGYDFSFNYYSDVNYVCSALVTKAYLPEYIWDEWIHITLSRIGTGITYPPNDIVKKLAEEDSTLHEELEFVAFIDASEKKWKSILGNKKVFLRTILRSRLSIFLP